MYTECFHLGYYTTLLSWLKTRDAYLPKWEEMPDIGFVAKEGDTPIAMAFLRMCEGNYAQLDGLASNPTQPSALRHEAIDLVVAKVVNRAKELHIRQLIAYTVDESTLLRSKKHGFVQLPHSLIAIDLS